MEIFNKVEPALNKLKKRLLEEGIKTLDQLEYDRYLRSVFWKQLRDLIKTRDNNRCTVCKKEDKDLEVHHRSYEVDVLEGKNTAMLTTLCPRCHHEVEHYSDGGKRSDLNEKDSRLSEIREIFIELEKFGLPIKVNRIEKKSNYLIKLEYVGRVDFDIFFSFQSLIYNFALKFYFDHKEIIRIPLPFGTEKFKNKSGARFYNKGSNKELFNIKICSANAAILKVNNCCDLELENEFLNFILLEDYCYIST